MNIISETNQKLLNDLNVLLVQAGIYNPFTFKLIETNEEVGAIISIPSLFDPAKKPYMMAFKENYRTSPMSYPEIIATLNDELHEMLMVIKPEILKLIRIKEAFKSQPEISPLDNKKVIEYDIQVDFSVRW